MGKPFVLLGFEGHDLNCEIVEVWAAYPQCFLEVVDSCHAGIFSGDEKQILERTQFADSFALVFDLCRGEHHASHFVVAVEAAVHT